MKTKLLLFSLFFILTLWIKPLHGQCDAEFTVTPVKFCTEFDTMHMVNNSIGAELTYIWEFDGQILTDFEPNIVAYRDGNYWIYLTITDGTCTNTDSLEVTIYETPVCDLGNDTTICDGNPIQLFGGLGANFWWNGIWGEESTLLVSTPGIYTLRLDDGRCVNFDTIMVYEGISPDPINLGNDTLICIGESIILDAGPANSYFWNTGATTQTIEVTQTGTYNVTTYNDPLGDCSSFDEIIITYDAIEPPNLGDDITSCGEVTIGLQNGPFVNQFWNTGETTENITVSTSGEYSIITTDSNLCSGYDTIQVICNPFPETNLVGDTTVVAGATIALTPNSNFGVEPLSDASGIEFIEATKGITVTNDFTLGIIINPSIESFDYYGGLISRGNGSQINQMDFIWFLKPDRSFELHLRNGTDSIILTSTSTLTIGIDYVLTATISSTNGVKLYANGIEVGATTETISISDLGGSLNILRMFNEQYNPTLGHCSSKSAVFTGAFIWNSVLIPTEISNWNNNTTLLPQAENLALELWFNDNKGNRVVNKVNGSVGYVYDLKKWKGNFPFANHHNPYQTVNWSIGSTAYGIEVLIESSSTIDVTVTNEFSCENSAEISITVEDSVITNSNNVTIYYQDLTPVSSGKIKIWKVTGNKKTLLDMVDIIDGVANLGELAPGAYALHIIGISGYHSFFYQDANNIQGADLIVLENGDYIDLNIEIPVDPPNKSQNKEITGTVSGYLTYAPTGKGAGVYKSGLPKEEGDPIVYEVVEVNILATTPLDWLDELTLYQTFMAGVSDETGYFEIANIPLGEYTVYPNLSQYDSIVVDPYTIEVTPENTVFEDLNYEVDSTTGTGTGTTAINETDVISDDILVYPNPAQHYIIIDLSDKQNAEIRLYNAMGKAIHEQKIYNKQTINLSSYPRGIYFMQIVTNQGTYSKKIILE